SRRRHTRFSRDWSSDVCSSDLAKFRYVNSVRLRIGLTSVMLVFERFRYPRLNNWLSGSMLWINLLLLRFSESIVVIRLISFNVMLSVRLMLRLKIDCHS